MSTLKVDTINEKSTNGNIAITPTGSGKLVLDGLTYPHADGSASQVMQTNGSGVLSFSTISAGFTHATEQATTSGSAITFSSIPAGVSLIKIMLKGVGTNGTAPLVLTIGDAGGLETSGYKGTASSILATSANTVNYTGGFFDLIRVVASNLSFSGCFTLALEDSSDYSWVISGTAGCDDTNTQGFFTGGSKSLSAELTQLQFKTSDTFDEGVINIMYM